MGGLGHEEAWLPEHERLALEADRDARHDAAERELRHGRPRRPAASAPPVAVLPAPTGLAEPALPEGTEAWLPHHERTRIAADRDAVHAAERRDLEMTREMLVTGSGASGFPVRWSWLQWRGSYELIRHLVSGDYDQAIDALPGQVLIFPFEVAVFLLATESALWRVATVLPAAFPNTTDPTTGLAQAFMASNNCWGFDPIAGEPYFNDDGASIGYPARLFLDGANTPYLVY